jgi:hypothetical protein
MDEEGIPPVLLRNAVVCQPLTQMTAIVAALTTAAYTLLLFDCG